MTIAQAAPAQAQTPNLAHYDRFTITLHWLTAGLVILLFALALGWDLFEHGSPLRKGMQSLHISLGILLGVVILTRLAWRFTGGRRLPPASSGWLQRAATGMHVSLYVLLVAQVILGLTLRWAQAESFMFFGLFPLQFSGTEHRTLAHTIEELHDAVAWIIISLAGLHAAAALVHHYVWKDGVLRRMLPRAPR